MEKGDLRSIGGFRGDPQGEVREKALSKAELLMILRDYIVGHLLFHSQAVLADLLPSKSKWKMFIIFLLSKGTKKILASFNNNIGPLLSIFVCIFNAYMFFCMNYIFF